MIGNSKAPDGMLWVCGACGKLNQYRYGFDESGKRCGPSSSWDESCMMHAVLCFDSVPIGVDRPSAAGIRWMAVEPQP